MKEYTKKNLIIAYAQLHERRRQIISHLSKLNSDRKQEYGYKAFVLTKKIDALRDELILVNSKLDEVEKGLVRYGYNERYFSKDVYDTNDVGEENNNGL